MCTPRLATCAAVDPTEARAARGCGARARLPAFRGPYTTLDLYNVTISQGNTEIGIEVNKTDRDLYLMVIERQKIKREREIRKRKGGQAKVAKGQIVRGKLSGVFVFLPPGFGYFLAD